MCPLTQADGLLDDAMQCAACLRNLTPPTFLTQWAAGAAGAIASRQAGLGSARREWGGRPGACACGGNALRGHGGLRLAPAAGDLEVEEVTPGPLQAFQGRMTRALIPVKGTVLQISRL